MTLRRRLDAELVRRRLVASREEAQEAIAGGLVLVDGAPAGKPSRQVSAAESITVRGAGRRFVGRGGDKLDAALDGFGVDPSGRVALDAGASTGGFTDCLLQRGALRVVAVDVGYGQLHDKLRRDERVEVRERTNVRDLVLDDPVDLVVADLSFISLRTVARSLVVQNAAESADVIVLVKPQFEAGRAEASRGRGVIRDPTVWRTVLGGVRSAMSDHGATMMDVMVSPITGADGNIEFLAHVHAHESSEEVTDARLDAVVDEAVRRHGREPGSLG